MRHAQEVARLIVWQYAVDGLVANDHALLMIKFTCVWGNIAASNMDSFRIRHTGLELRRFPYGYVVCLVGDKIFGLALAVYARLKHRDAALN